MTTLSRYLSLSAIPSKRFHCTAIAFFIGVSVLLLLGVSPSYGDQNPTSSQSNDAELIRVIAPGNKSRYAATVRAHATAALRDLNAKTGDALLVPVTYVVAENDAEFNKMAGGGSEHALAVAFGEEQRVIINYQLMSQSGSEKIRQVLVHELAHVYLEVKCNTMVPHWVHEGVAQQLAGEWTNAPGDAQLAIAAYTGGLIPLRELVHGFPVDMSSRNQAYSEALSVTRFLIREDYGNSLATFLASIRGDKGVGVLRPLAGGVHLDSLELRWRNDLKSPMHALSIIVSSGFFWGLAAILVVIAYMVKRRRSKLIHQQWAKEEAVAAEFESIHDRIDRFDEGLEAELMERDEPPAQFEPEETPYDRYLSEQEHDDRY